MVMQLDTTHIGRVLDDLVENGFDYQEDYTDWQDALYDVWDNNQEDPDVIRAALVFLSDHAGDSETVWTPRQFRRLMDTSYKAKYATKGQFAREYVNTATDYVTDTIDAFTDYTDWNRYADDNLSGDYAMIQLDGELSDVYVFARDFTY